MLGFAGQFTTVLPSLRAYLYCIRAKTFTNEHEIRRNDKGTKGTIKTVIACTVYQFNRTALGIGMWLNPHGYLFDLLQSIFN